MPFQGSYLWRLRQKVGSEFVLHPGAMVFLVREDGAVLFTRRVDNGMWCLPAGGAEEGSSGDVSHCFAMLFLARRWRGDPQPDGEETTAMSWADPAAAPSPLEDPATRALELFRAYSEAGVFQIA